MLAREGPPMILELREPNTKPYVTLTRNYPPEQQQMLTEQSNSQSARMLWPVTPSEKKKYIQD